MSGRSQPLSLERLVCGSSVSGLTLELEFNRWCPRRQLIRRAEFFDFGFRQIPPAAQIGSHGADNPTRERARAQVWPAVQLQGRVI